MITDLLDALGITMPVVALTGLYAALAFLLLGLHLKSAWSWPAKTAVIGLALPATIGAFWAIQAQLGWPNPAPLPARFQLHAALVEEPVTTEDPNGAIFLWVTPWRDVLVQNEYTTPSMPTSRRPRAFGLPYTRELHQEIDTMRERLARGELVIGSHDSGDGWKRRFGMNHGQTNLEAPPPPPLPAKDG